MLKRLLYSLFFIFLLTGFVYANQPLDIPQTYGARINGQGSAGMAYADGGMSMTINPAGLARVEKIMFEGTLTNMMMTLKAPVNGAYNEKSLTSYSPLGLFGIGARINKRIVVGAMLYTPSGGGAKYNDVTLGTARTDDYYGYLYFIEFGPAIAFNITKNLRVGFVWRFNYAKTVSRTHSPDPTNPTTQITDMDTEMDGFGFTGYRIGIQWQPLSFLHIGVAYRSFIKIRTEGEAETDVYLTSNANGAPVGAYTADVSRFMRYADKFSIGFTWEAIKKELFISLDYGIDFYSRSKGFAVESKVMGIGNSTFVPYNYKDGHTVRLGAEWMGLGKTTLRAGMGWGSGAGDEKYHSYANSGVTQNWFWTLGAGYKITDESEVNLSLAYMLNEGEVNSSSFYATNGDYRASGWYLSIGGRFKF